MKLFEIHRNVMSGQCKNTLLRLQIGYTAIFFGYGLIRGYAGTRIGLFTPVKTDSGYVRKGFYFWPWLSRDIAVCRLPKWQCKLFHTLSFEFSLP